MCSSKCIIPYVFDIVNEMSCRHDDSGNFHCHPAVVSECKFKLKINCEKTEEHWVGYLGKEGKKLVGRTEILMKCFA